MTQPTEKANYLSALLSVIQIRRWEEFYFQPDRKLLAEIRITKTDEKCLLELSVNCKTTEKIPISLKAFNCLSVGRPFAHFDNVETYVINQFVPTSKFTQP